MALSRRKIIQGLIGAGALVLGGRTPAWPLPTTPPCDDGDDDDLTPSVTEGPFYTPNTPKRTVLREPGIPGTPLVIEGRVLSTGCVPIAGAVLDFWSCDGKGIYDNEGFKLRGHQFTDKSGAFRVETVKPAPYRQYGAFRTPHVHVRVKGPKTSLLTTQLFFPGEPLNDQDRLIRDSLVMEVRKNRDGSLRARFDFVLA